MRSSSVGQALQNNYGVDLNPLTAVGRGEYNPVANNGTSEGRVLNRRTLNQFMEMIEQAPQRSADNN